MTLWSRVFLGFTKFAGLIDLLGQNQILNLESLEELIFTAFLTAKVLPKFCPNKFTVILSLFIMIFRWDTRMGEGISSWVTRIWSGWWWKCGRCWFRKWNITTNRSWSKTVKVPLNKTAWLNVMGKFDVKYKERKDSNWQSNLSGWWGVLNR